VLAGDEGKNWDSPFGRKTILVVLERRKQLSGEGESDFCGWNSLLL
jgi:hypothetical protein